MHEETVQDLWDAFHPAESDEDIADEFEDDGEVEFTPPTIPTIDELPNVVDYSTRGPNDFVVSGPMGAGRGPGRHFESERNAYIWATSKYGRQRVVRIPQESEFRWALLIKAA